MSKRSVTNRLLASASSQHKAEDDEVDTNAEGTDTEVEANADEVDVDAEEGDETEIDAEVEDDTKQASAVKTERARCSGLHALSAQARRLGVRFNAAKAIETGLSLATARTRVLNAAATVDSAELSSVVTPRNGPATKAGTISAEAKASAWKKGLKR